MSRFEIHGDFWADGAVVVRNAFGPAQVELAREAIDANLEALSPLAKRASSTDDGAFVEDFCNWSRIRRDRAVHPPVGCGCDRRRADGVRAGAALPRPRARQGARHAAAHAVAPGPAVLQRRRASERQHVDPGRSGVARLRRSSSSPARISARGSCRGRSSTGRRSGSPTGRWPSCPTSTAGPTTSGSSGGTSNPATPCASTCSRCTPRAASTARTGGACCRSGSSVTTWCTRRASG